MSVEKDSQRLATVILNHAWRLERPNGEVRSSFVTFFPNSSIAGYYHPNEATWGISDGKLQFRSKHGAITAVSQRVIVDTRGEATIEMVHADDTSAIAHRLRDLGEVPVPYLFDKVSNNE